jgi:hypothetical protein
MANTIIAGNGTNNGLAVTSDNTGALNILTGSGAGTAAISIDSSQNVTIAGTLSASGGVTGSLKSATVQASTSGTSIDFTSIPSGVKRITVMFSGVSTNGTSNLIVQIGTGTTPTYTTTGYAGGVNNGAGTNTNYSSGFQVTANLGASDLTYGAAFINNISGNTWVCNGTMSNGGIRLFSGAIALAATLTAVRITTVNGTDTFDAGSINIIYE